jgi:hypothetical protein
MSVLYNKCDDVYWFDTTAEISSDTEYVKMKTAKAIAFDDTSKVYVSNGLQWVEMG